jgi:hypothetical protein
MDGRRAAKLRRGRLPKVALEMALRYTDAMTRDQVKEILDRVRSWRPERQADVAHVVELMEEQDSSAVRLSDDDLAELRRRRGKKSEDDDARGTRRAPAAALRFMKVIIREIAEDDLDRVFARIARRTTRPPPPTR